MDYLNYLNSFGKIRLDKFKNKYFNYNISNNEIIDYLIYNKLIYLLFL